MLPMDCAQAMTRQLRSGALGAVVVMAALAFSGAAAAHDHFVYFADDLPSGGVGPTMVSVPGGVVPPCRESDPLPCTPVSAEPVDVGSFAMSAREVSVAEFRVYANRTGYKTWAEERTELDGGCLDELVPRGDGEEPRWDLAWNALPWAHGDDHAVVCITYKDATAYAQWLARETGKPYRLPTELEWRHALLANGPAPVLTSNDLPCVFRPTRNGGLRGVLRPVGSCGPNPFGLYEMAGGVNEWTECVEATWTGCRTPAGRSGCLQGFLPEMAVDLGVSWNLRSKTPSLTPRPGGADWLGAISGGAWATRASQEANIPEPPRWQVDDVHPWALCGSTTLYGFRVALSSSH